jgi:RNA polymerase sigma factor (sigma-70 family)
MAGDTSDEVPPRRALADLLDGYLVLIRQAVRRAASRRAAPFQDDIAQVVAAAVWRQLEKGQSIDRPSSYVYTAVVRETVRALRREQGRHEVSLDAPDADGLEREVDSGTSLEADLEARRLGEVIEACLDGLAEDRARAVRAHLAGFDVAETMALYGWTYQRARNLVARGLADLRAALRARGVEP